MDKPSPYMDQHAPSENTLFAQAEWVQGVVRAMVRDEHLAQDIAQDAMEAGLHAGRHKIRDPRAWLMGVVRNLHGQDARSGIRRRNVEQRKQEKVEEPSSAELLARLEVQQIVARAVMELPDPFRSVLILRFYEGAPIRTVAVRRNIDRKKAESQVRRGLTLLHGRLKGRLGDTWAVAVLPLALPATASAMTATVAGLAGAVSAKVLVGVAASALALIGFGLWGFPGDSNEEQTREGIQAAVVAATTAELPALATESLAEAPSSNQVERTVLNAAPAIEGDWVLRGLLTEGSDPAPHARVVLEMRTGQDISSLVLHEIPLVSDAHGRIAWNGEAPSGAVYMQLRSADPEEHPGRGRGIFVLPGAPPPQDLDLQFHSWPREIRGLITDVHGVPISGAMVRTVDRVGETNADGRFQLPASLYGSSDFVYAHAPGFAQLMKLAYFHGEIEDVAEVDFFLPEEILVRGRVVDQHGIPISGAEVSKLMSRWQVVTTDHVGEFELGNLPAEGSGFDLYAKKSGYAASKITIGDLPAGTETDVEFVMTRGGIIQGHVTDYSGAAIAAAKITISSSKHRGDSRAAYSAVDGFFRIDGILSGLLDIKVERLGFAPIQRVVEMGSGDGQLLEMPIQLESGREITVTILDTNGNPLAGGWASALRREDAPRIGSMRTGASGITVLSNVHERVVDLEIGRPGYGKVVVSVGPEEDQLEVRLDPIPVLRGVVLDAETGEPVQNFRIQLTHVETGEDEIGVGGISMELLGGREFQSVTGEWEIRYDLEPHHWLGFYVIAEGYTLFENLRVQMPSGGQALSLISNLDRGGTLSGIVTPRSGGMPIANAKITWVDPNQIPSDLQMNVRNPSTTSDAQGRFELGGIPLGEASLIIEHKDWARHLEGPIALSPADHNKEIHILLDEAVALSGSVYAADGAPMEAVRVTATPEGLSALRMSLSTSTDANGQFQIDGLPMASYRIHAEVQTRGLWWTLYLADGQAIGADGLDLTIRREGTARITGRITGNDDLPEVVPVRAVKLSGDGQGDEYGGLAIDGSFEIHDLPPGMYRVEVGQGNGAQQPSVITQSVTVEVAGDGTVDVELRAAVD